MMKIRIASGNYRMMIPVPYFMMNNPITRIIVKKTLHSDEVQMDLDVVLKLMSEFSKIAKAYKGLELVRVETSDGQFVQIVL